MRKVSLSPIRPSAPDKEKLDWCIKVIQQIATASNVPEEIAVDQLPAFDEAAQDAVGGILDDGTVGDIVFTYDDATPGISGAIKAGAVGPDELASTAVTPGDYGTPTAVGGFTVDADGRITAAADKSIQTASDSAAGLVELATSAETVTGTDATRAVTPAGLTAAAVKQGRHTIWVPAAAMTPDANSANGPTSVATELSNDITLQTLDFDPDGFTAAFFYIAMPKSWDEGDISLQLYWTAASGSGDVKFNLGALAFSNDDNLDLALVSNTTVVDTLLAANDLHIIAESSAFTPSGSPAENDVLVFRIARDAGNVLDTFTADVKLIGVKLFYTVDAGNDA